MEQVRLKPWSLDIAMPKLKDKGFTLVEMIAVIVIIATIAAIAGKLIQEGFESAFTSQDTLAINSQGRFALEKMGQELREVPRPSDLSTIPNNQIAFINKDDLAISYYLDAATKRLLRKQGSNSPNPVADHVTGLSISYLQADGVTPTTVASLVRYINIQLTLDSGGISYSYQTRISPRNFV